MIIEERIYQLLVPSVLPTLYPQIAPDNAVAPFTVYSLWNKVNLTTHSAPLPLTRVWSMQFSTYSPSYLATRTIGSSIEVALVGYTDGAIQGITQDRVMMTWDDIAKLHCNLIELQITEQLT
jgi:hypothetical protein